MLANRLDELEQWFEAHIQQVEQNFEALIVEQGQWIEAGVQEPLRGLQELWHRVDGLMRRMLDMKEYLGLQGGAQAIVLFDGQRAERVTRIREGLGGETSQPMPNPEADATTNLWLTQGMEEIEEIDITLGGQHQDDEEVTAVPPVVNTEANANANANGEETGGMESKDEVVELRTMKEKVDEEWTDSAVLKRGRTWPRTYR